MAERGKGFPRISLSSAVQIMDAASKFGKSWKKEQFASFGAKNGAGSAKSGAFAARLSALRDYGLIVTTIDSVDMTDLAVRMTKPVNADEREDAIKSAFLSVATFNDLYVSFDDALDLERSRVAEYAVFNLGISRDSMDKFVNVFIDAGEYAGLVQYAKETDSLRLIKALPANSTDGGIEQATASGNDESQIVTFATTASVLLKDTAMNEQGVNHSGNGWGLSVLVKSSHRLPADLRKAIRDLLESADLVADKFYDLERSDKDE